MDVYKDRVIEVYDPDIGNGRQTLVDAWYQGHMPDDRLLVVLVDEPEAARYIEPQNAKFPPGASKIYLK